MYIYVYIYIVTYFICNYEKIIDSIKKINT